MLNLEDKSVRDGSTIETDIRDSSGSRVPRIRFTIWHVMLLMTAVAFVYSIDESIGAMFMGVAMCGLIIAPLLLVVPMLTRSKRQTRPAKIERALITFLTQVTVWSAIIVIFIAIAMTLKYLMVAISLK